MGVYGPQYPPKLQGIINHAERLSAVLARAEVRCRPLGELARAWLAGRPEEVETVLAGLVDDWRSGALSEHEATKSAAAYLRALHLGAEQHLEFGSLSECCLADFAITPLRHLSADDLVNRVREAPENLNRKTGR